MRPAVQNRPASRRPPPPPRGAAHALQCGCRRCEAEERELFAGLADNFEWEGETTDRSSAAYVSWVQRSLNRLQAAGLDVDGISGPLTRAAVKSFQTRKGLDADGIVGPITEAALVAAGADKPPLAASPAPAPWPGASPPAGGPAQLSGSQWVAQFPTSRSTDDLAEPFRSNAKRFIAALTAAGAKVSLAATRRPAERAWLMHYAWAIAKDGLSPASVPANPAIPIRWVHTDAAGRVDLGASRAAAAAMVQGYGMAYPAALDSQHIRGLAFDADITWSGTLRIPDGRTGATKAISSTPSNGADNRDLHAVGASYGVIKLASDPPHWSIDGH